MKKWVVLLISTFIISIGALTSSAFSLSKKQDLQALESMLRAQKNTIATQKKGDTITVYGGEDIAHKMLDITAVIPV
ncbi:MAG: hypothetical protein A3E83_06230 [Gammaproteobacteria bacterium RIFCSPHIGHO2_12_FULL_41_20]|nr:MAG: hypothetical protein A3E83_06230 [Gammaproteobacteria bacterium RIFCSPHIGHO2_12_FULL_41_20]